MLRPMSMNVQQSLKAQQWHVRLTNVHPRDRGITGDTSEPPADLLGRDLVATVPGQIHLDLLREGVIADPVLAMNEYDALWTGRADWTYTTTLSVDTETLGREHVELCFDGLDTFATVLVNGTIIGESRNAHRRYRFDTKAAMRVGENTIEVQLNAPLPQMREADERQGEMPRSGGPSRPSQPHNAVRRMSCDCGWDWGPATPTSGIWRDVRLEAWDAGRLGDVRPVVVEATSERAVVELHADVEGRGDAVAKLMSPDGKMFEVKGGKITIESPQLWWPRGHGEQPLYELVVELIDGGKAIDSKTHRVGLRTVELATPDDGDSDSWPVDGVAKGSGMFLRINGSEVYCKGSNWIPDDIYPARVDSKRYRTRLQQAADANMNMIRVWGGGLYESHDFYDICDEIGLMVWQDFTFACATYSEVVEVVEEVDAEARDNVSRLTRHASLVLFNGNNENLWGYHDWSYDGKRWPEAVGDRGWGLKYYFEVLPNVVEELAPATPYWPGSPSNGGTREQFENSGVHPNANEYGNRHIWNVWHGPGHYLGYVGHSPRFCSEFGFHGQPTWPAIEQSIPEDQRRWYSPTMRSHNKNGYDKKVGDGQDKSTTRVSDDFVVPDDFDEWLYLTQVAQARAMTVSLGWFRSLFPYNNGALIWQLNDCWPGSSWSLVDLDTNGIGRLKPAWFAVRRAFLPRVCNVMPKQVTQVTGWGDDAGLLRAYLHNDHAETWAGSVRLRHMTFGGETLAETSNNFTIGSRAADFVDVPENWTSNRRSDAFIVAEPDGGERSFWWFSPDRNVAEHRPQVSVSMDGSLVIVIAKTLVRDLCLFPERLNAQASADDACVTLLPGESHTFEVRGGETLDAEAMLKSPVLQYV